MALKKFDTSNAGFRTGEATLSFNNAGMVRISKDAVEELELKVGNRVLLSQDEDEDRDWFIQINDPNGFPTRLNGSNKKAKSLCFNCSFLTNKILEQADEEKSVTCKLITAAVDIDGVNYYPFIIPKK